MQYLYVCFACILGGVLSGMGMGGGTLTIPILVLGFGVSQFSAQFANLLAFLPSGGVAFALHLKNGLVRTSNLGYLLFSSIIFCIVSAFFATKMQADLLRMTFGVFLCVVAICSLIAKVCKKNKNGVFTTTKI